MAYPIQPVPTPRQTQPLQNPGMPDNAGIFFQALQARQAQQRDQVMAQKALGDSLLAMASLMEKKREADLEDAQKGAMLDFHNRMASVAAAKEAREDQMTQWLMSGGATSTGQVGGQSYITTVGKQGPKTTFAPQPKTSQDPNAVLSVNDAKTMGVPYGTTRGQASAMGKTPISEQAGEKLQAANNAMSQLDLFEKQLSGIGLPDNPNSAAITGRLLYMKGKAVPASPEGLYLSAINNVSNLARSYGERGVLTDYDIARIQSAIPALTDTNSSMRMKLDTMRDIAEESQHNVSLGLSRENVTSYRDTLENFLSRKSRAGISKEYAVQVARDRMARGLLVK